MNIKQFNMTFKMIFVMAIVVFLVSAPAYAAAGGNTVKVITKDGMRFKGELLAVSNRTLVIFDQAIEKESRVGIDDLLELALVHKSVALKRVVDGALIGIMTANAIAGDGHIADEYKSIRITFSGLMGGAIGGLSSLLNSKEHRYPIRKMSPSEIDALLLILNRSSRESAEGSEYKGFLGRLRISWKPFFNHGFKYYSNATLSFPGNSIPGNSKVTGTGSAGMSSREDPPHSIRFRIDYAIKKRLEVGVEYLSLGNHSVSTYGTAATIMDGKNYKSDFYIPGSHSANIGLVGASYDLVGSAGASVGMRIDASAGLSVSRFTMSPYRYYYYSFLKETHSFNVIKPAFQVGLTLEPSTRKSISTGMYVGYLYAPTTMSKFSATGTAEFVEDKPYDGTRTVAFTREATFTAPKSNFNMGGFSLGFLIRIH